MSVVEECGVDEIQVNHELWFNMATQVARDATCTRAHCGSVLVSSSGSVIGQGFNAPPLNMESQRQCSADLGASRKPKSDRTCCVHAEWNAILDGLTNHPTDVNGSSLYFMRVDDHGDHTDAGEPYCTVCSRLALQAGVALFGLWNDGPEMIATDSYNLRSYGFHLGENS